MKPPKSKSKPTKKPAAKRPAAKKPVTKKPAAKKAATKKRAPALTMKDLMGFFIGFQKPAKKSKYPSFVIATIKEPLEPLERGDKYEDPLNAALKRKRIGIVTGGGTQTNERFDVVSADLEIELADLDGALEFTRQKLLSLGAPKGSKIHFTQDGKKRSIPIVK